MIERAERHLLLVDKTKFEARSLERVCPLSNIDDVVADAAPGRALREALAELERSTVLREAFGDQVIEHYLHTGRWEQLEYDRRVTDWELIRNFERA